jgi:hypothetical protein
MGAPEDPFGQVVEQVPEKHPSVAAHAFPHPPQFAWFDAVKTQAVPHSVCPAPHVHLPALQVEPGLQDVPQPPQLAESDVVSTHAAPHWVAPGIAGHDCE